MGERSVEPKEKGDSMKTYFTYKGLRVRIARDSGVMEDRYTEQQILDALESGDAVIENEFILDSTQTNKIMGVFEPLTVIDFNIEHCGHCALRSDDKNDGRGHRCYIFEVKEVTENVKEKTINEHCPLRKCELVFKIKKS